MKDLPEQQAHKAADAAVDKKKFLMLFILFCSQLTFGQTLPQDEIQANFSGYFDNFSVNVLYPSVSLTHHISNSTSFSGRYLVDMITAASIKSNSTSSSSTPNTDNEIGKSHSGSIDAITSASSRAGGEEFSKPIFDDVRNEFNVGLTHLMGKSLLTVNGIYSTEKDYTSNTLAGTFQQYFAENNTSLQIGFVKSWDEIYPKTKSWTKKKNVFTLSANFSQILSKNFIFQILGSYSKNAGLLADVYEQVTLNDGTVTDPVHPDTRIRKSSAVKLKFRISSSSSIETGYRYYWDSWNIKSNTVNITYMKYISKHTIMSLGLRNYAQTRAFFFKPTYTADDLYKSVDIKLDSGHSTEYQIGFTILGGDRQHSLPFLDDDRMEYDFNINFYSRHSTTPYWYNGKNGLFATNINLGFRYRLR